jgi:hypothetical protein
VPGLSGTHFRVEGNGHDSEAFFFVVVIMWHDARKPE